MKSAEYLETSAWQTLPAITQPLLDGLDKLFPVRLPSRLVDHPDRELAFIEGQRSVVEFLKKVMAYQSDNLI
jgi:hypothetical protein